MKKNIPGLLAAGIALSLSAFTMKHRQTDPLWELVSGTNPTIATNYFKVLSTPPCNGGPVVCSLTAPETYINGISRPNLGAFRTQNGTTQTIGSWINQALNAGAPNNFVKLSPQY